jgi:signal transduction histidine kinase
MILVEELKKFSIFNKMEEEKLLELSNKIKKAELSPGEVVCSEDSIANSMFFIHSGKLEVSKKGVPLAVLNEMEYFGEMSLLEDALRSATITTLEKTVVFEITKKVFDDFLRCSPSVMYNIVMTYDKRLRSHNELVVEQFLKLKKQYKELEGTYKQLLQTEKLASIGMLTSGIAHEINNPLTIIYGYIEFLKMELSSKGLDNEEFTKIIAALENATEAIRKIVLGLKTFIHVDEEEQNPFDINSAIQGSIDLVSFLYEKEKIDIETEFSTENIEVVGNIGGFQQVIMNLFSNAKDAMEKSSVKKIKLRTFLDGNNVILEASDTGCGMSEETCKKIFEKFFTTKPVGKGTGLGLDILQNIIKKMNGQIDVRSKENEGTTFIIKLPAFKDDENI